MLPLHADELTIDVGLVRRLVDRAFPEYTAFGVVPLRDPGSSNALFRLGDHLLVRLPRQPGGGATIDKEAHWLPFVAARVSASVPEVIGVGEPDLGYGERWAITRWLDGTTPSAPRVGSTSRVPEGLAVDLARFVDELRAIEVPHEAATDQSLSWYRGMPLSALDADFRAAVLECRGLDTGLDLDDALRVWDQAVGASQAAPRSRAWFHGDLLAENLLVEDGRLAAVLDFGGLAVGDPAVDLIVAWEVLDADGRRAFRRVLDVDDATWATSRGWALLIAMITVPYYATTMPRRCAHRLAMAQAAIAAC